MLLLFSTLEYSGIKTPVIIFFINLEVHYHFVKLLKKNISSENLDASVQITDGTKLPCVCGTKLPCVCGSKLPCASATQ